jgi:hypothetical protein
MKLFIRTGWIVLLVTLGVTWFARDRLDTVRKIHPAALQEPTQTPLTNATSFAFSRNGYAYEVEPLHRYILRGLIVHRLDYSWFAIDRSEKVFPLDLCVIWGRNLSNGVYRAPSMRFSQDCRFCYAQWDGAVKFWMDELSNNHLLVNNPALERQLQQLRTGDQIKLTGQLVNVKAKATGDIGRYDSPASSWKTSTTRTDTGAGACEVIYVESVQVLKPGNPLARQLYRAAWIGLLLFAGWRLVAFFRSE